LLFQLFGVIVPVVPSFWQVPLPLTLTHDTYSGQSIKPILWRNIILPVEIILNIWYEQQPYFTSYSKEQALYHARQRALDAAIKQLPAGCQLLSQTTRELPSGAGQVKVQVTWEARADIGRFMPLDAERAQLYEQKLTSPADALE